MSSNVHITAGSLVPRPCHVSCETLKNMGRPGYESNC